MKRIKLLNLLFSFFISISINLKLIIDNNLNYFIKHNIINFTFIMKIIGITILVYFILELLFYLLDKVPLKNKELNLNKKKIFIIFICIFIPSMIYLLSHYPGVYLNDTMFMIYSPILRGAPIIFSLFLAASFHILSNFFGNFNAIFIMSTTQVLIASIILTYIVYWFNNKTHNKILTILLILYYVLTPILANYNVALNKDTPFALLILLFFTFICDIVESKGKLLSDKGILILLVAISCLSICIRNNGLYIAIISILLLFIIYGIKNYKKECSIVLILIILFSFLPVVLVNVLHAEKLKREYYGVPIQQVCYLVKYHPDKLNKKDYNTLSKFIKDPKKTIPEKYDVYTVDSIKFQEEFDSDKFNKSSKEFLSLWIRKYPSNISSYTKSYLLNSYHLWSINKLETGQSTFRAASMDGPQGEEVYNKQILPQKIQDSLLKFYDKYNTYLNPAGCFILLLIINLYAYYRKKKDIIIISIPLFVVWFILMLGSPQSGALRYMSPYLYILPIIGLYTFKITRKDDKHGLSRTSKTKLSKKRKRSV